jgi:acyl-CoA synthetase (AMP-forming)/AMP-acid ligase II
MFFVSRRCTHGSPAPGGKRLGALRLCACGSAPLSADLHAEIAANCDQTVLERYGMTETMMLTSNPYEGERRAGTVFPLPGVDLRLHEQTGEILVRGPRVRRLLRATRRDRRGVRARRLLPHR